MKKLILLMSLLVLGNGLYANELAKAYFTNNYDADSATATACITKGLGGTTWGVSTIPGDALIKTTGSTTAVVAVTAGTLPFFPIAVGDSILVTRTNGTTDFRTVTVKTDNDTITVDTAVDWSGGFSFRYLKTICGTAATDGWLDVSSIDDLKLVMEWNQGDLTSLDVRFECEDLVPGGQAPITVYPGETDGCGAGGTLVAGPYCNLLNASMGQAARIAVAVYEPWDACRILLKVNTDASDVGANLEQVTTYAVGRKRNP